MFRASPGVQRPVLLNALSSARDSEESAENWLHARENLIKECNRIPGLCSGTETKDAKSIEQLCDGFLDYIAEQAIDQQLSSLSGHYPIITATNIKLTLEGIRDVVREGIRNEGQQYEAYAVIDVNKRRRIEDSIKPLLSALLRLSENSTILSTASADCPRFFSKWEFRYRYLEHGMTCDEASSTRARDNCFIMLMDIYRLLEYSCFEFMFGPTCSEWPSVTHSLATFMRDILGAGCFREAGLTGTDACPEGQLPFYDRQRGGSTRSDVVIIDLSLLASEVLENVTAPIGRLIHEFLWICEKQALFQKGRTRNSIEAGPKRRNNLILKPYVKDGRAGNLAAQLLLISLMVLLRMEVRRND